MKPLDRRLLSHARETAVAFAVAVGLGLATAVLAVAQAMLLATAITRAFMDRATLGALQGTLVALALVLGARAAIGWAQEAAAYRISARVKSSLRRQVLERALTLGPRWASEARSGEVVSLVTRGLDALDPYFARALPQLVLSVIVPVVVVTALALNDLVATLTVALTVPLVPVFMALIGIATQRRRDRRWTALTRLSHRFLDVVVGLPTLRIFGRSRGQLAALRSATDDYRRESLATLRIAFLSAFALELLSTLSVALVAVGVGLRLVNGEIDLRTGLFVLVLAPEAYLPLRRLGADYHASEEGLAAARAAIDLIETRPAVESGHLPVPDLGTSELRLRDVSVSHPGRPVPAPDGLSLDVRPGEVVGLSGPSGLGKSTTLWLLLGLLEPNAGSVVLDAGGAAIPVASLDGDAWRRQLAWVPQSPFLAAGTVAENVRLVAPAASDAEIAAALLAVGLGGIPLELRLGERGSGLSSGQGRRIAVARALLRPARFLLLDEPTAGLDAVSERLVLDAVRAAARERGQGVLIVAHRPAALAIADRVVELEPSRRTEAA